MLYEKMKDHFRNRGNGMGRKLRPANPVVSIPVDMIGDFFLTCGSGGNIYAKVPLSEVKDIIDSTSTPDSEGRDCVTVVGRSHGDIVVDIDLCEYLTDIGDESFVSRIHAYFRKSVVYDANLRKEVPTYFLYKCCNGNLWVSVTPKN